MPSGLIVGFDFGLRRIGVALGNTLTQQARPLTTLQAQQGIPNWTEVEQIFTEWQPDCLIVGAPYEREGGSNQHIFHCAKKFANRLHDKYKLTVHFVDERYTSAEARHISRSSQKSKHGVDSIAAVLITEDWLKSQ